MRLSHFPCIFVQTYEPLENGCQPWQEIAEGQANLNLVARSRHCVVCSICRGQSFNRQISGACIYESKRRHPGIQRTINFQVAPHLPRHTYAACLFARGLENDRSAALPRTRISGCHYENLCSLLRGTKPSVYF